jgi:extradiol dioxygenase family protein
MANGPALFHLSIPASDLDATEGWYVGGLGCRAGRRSDRALILNLGGHQLVAQLEGTGIPPQRGIYPRHFGLVFAEEADWQQLVERVRGNGLDFAVEPRCRYEGEELEHLTFFLVDPSGNWLEFKHYRRPEAILGCHHRSEVGDRELRDATASAEN